MLTKVSISISWINLWKLLWRSHVGYQWNKESLSYVMGWFTFAQGVFIYGYRSLMWYAYFWLQWVKIFLARSVATLISQIIAVFLTLTRISRKLELTEIATCLYSRSLLCSNVWMQSAGSRYSSCDRGKRAPDPTRVSVGQNISFQLYTKIRMRRKCAKRWFIMVLLSRSASSCKLSRLHAWFGSLNSGSGWTWHQMSKRWTLSLNNRYS